MRRIYPWPKTRDEHAARHQQRAGVMSQPLLYFMRHGETDWNAERRLQGQHDIPLNALGLDPARYRTDPRLAELSFGRWEGFTFAELQRDQADIRALATREHDKWAFVPPGGESYADLLVRVRQWHATVARDTVAVAHGGVARTLIVHLGIEPAAAAPVHDIEQGVVY